ncbi:winged helix DNA-binding domain-containing protein, partial [Marasmius fiardii PR-910]
PLANIPVLLDEVRYRLLGQLEYYLSAENMAKDMWLRGRMSPEGWIPLSVIMTFNRIKQLTDNLHLVKEVLGFSEHVEVMDEGDPDEARVRMRDGAWKRYLLP